MRNKVQKSIKVTKTGRLKTEKKFSHKNMVRFGFSILSYITLCGLKNFFAFKNQPTRSKVLNKAEKSIKIPKNWH